MRAENSIIIKYAPYSRCSSEEQAKKGVSHDYQLDGLRAEAARRWPDGREVGCWKDTITGKTFDRKGLSALERFCGKNRGALDYVLIFRWDRLGRDVGECFDLIKRFRDLGVEVNCPGEWMDYSDASWPLILGVKFGMAQSESLRIGDRTRSGLRKLAEMGYIPHQPPKGYTMQDEHLGGGRVRRLAVPNESAPIIRHCFEQFARGHGKMELFAEHGLKLRLSKNQFCRMFSNPIYAGRVVVPAHGKTPARTLQGRHEAIVPPTLFDECQRIQAVSDNPMKDRPIQTDEGSAFFLKGSLRSAKTGKCMTGYFARSKSGRRFGYYGGRGAEIVPQAEAERIVFEAMRDFEIQRDRKEKFEKEIETQLSERFGRLDGERVALLAAVEKCRVRAERLKTMLADGDITSAEFRELRDGFEREMLVSEKRIAEIEESLSERGELAKKALALCIDLREYVEMANFAGKTAILRAIFPEGFTLDRKLRKVRTPCLNYFMLITHSESMSYVSVEIENGPVSSLKTGPYHRGTAEGQVSNTFEEKTKRHRILLEEAFLWLKAA